MPVINWTTLPSLTALRAFDATARTSSFSAAARTLNVTHAAVAQQVKALEDHLGVTLLHRSPRGVVLTPQGESLATDLATGFTAIAEGLARVRDREETRPVRVTTTAYFANSVIFRHIADFWRAHPGVEVSFTPSDHSFDIVAEGYDIAIRAGGGDWPGLHVAHLVDSPTIACAAPALVDDPGTDWSAQRWLLPHDSTWERDALRASGIDPDGLNTLDVGNPALEIRAAEAGAGILLESEIDVHAALVAGTLKPAPIPITHVSSYYVVTPPWRPRAAVRAFADWLHTTCATG
ncbi:LysR family transcriptional regulator [Seohaeicola saemankumensis]|nr:LysR substrate-binding domain-containing protein [Seohaeicola saemankumensis]MCA0870976.1 LysR family transcriptional regulator [Seohaeicola saemankumensis]